MILYVEYDSDFLVILGYRSRITGHYYLGENHTNPNNPSDVKPDGLILTKYKNLWYVVVSIAETETGGLLING